MLASEVIRSYGTGLVICKTLANTQTTEDIMINNTPGIKSSVLEWLPSWVQTKVRVQSDWTQAMNEPQAIYSLFCIKTSSQTYSIL